MSILQAQKMSQNGHEERSCAERAGSSHATCRPRSARSVRVSERRPNEWPEQPSLPLLIYIASPPSGTLPHVKIRPVRPTDQCHGHRQHLRVGCKITVLRGRMGAEYSLLPRTTSDRPSRVATTRLVGVVCAQRVPVLHATPCGTLTRRRRATRVTHGGGQSRRLHGPHQDLPGTSGEAESSPRGLRGVLLPEGDRPLHDRCVRPVRRTTHRKPSREIPVRPRRILPESVPQPTHQVRETPPPIALLTNSQLPSHRTTLLREISRKDANRNPNQRYATLREFVLMAVHGDHVTYDVATLGSCLIDALRLPAVSAKPALRLPKVPA